MMIRISEDGVVSDRKWCMEPSASLAWVRSLEPQHWVTNTRLVYMPILVDFEPRIYVSFTFLLKGHYEAHYRKSEENLGQN
jgi:hypothetical protein